MASDVPTRCAFVCGAGEAALTVAGAASTNAPTINFNGGVLTATGVGTLVEKGKLEEALKAYRDRLAIRELIESYNDAVMRFDADGVRVDDLGMGFAQTLTAPSTGWACQLEPARLRLRIVLAVAVEERSVRLLAGCDSPLRRRRCGAHR